MSTIPAMYNRAPTGEITGVTFYVNFVPYQSDVSHAGFPLLLEELKKAEPDTDRLIALTRPIEAVREAVEDAVAADYLPAGVVSVSRDRITYNGEQVTGVLVERILTMLSEGFDIMPMVRFLENVYRNPATYAREELYLWLENNDLPITHDGEFLAYKNVQADFLSHHDSMTDNTPGTTVSMPRENVDHRRAQECSTGLHFCSKGYLPNYQGYGHNNVVVMLKINPADVVSIPQDSYNTKGRAWKYLVLHAIEDPQDKVWPAVVDNNGEEVTEWEDGTTDVGYSREETDAEIMAGDDAAWQDDDPRVQVGKLTWIGSVPEDHAEVVAATISSFDTYLADEEAAIDAETIPQEYAPRDPFAEGVRQDETARINSMGIIALRHAASKAGMPSAWHGPKRDELRAFLISKIS